MAAFGTDAGRHSELLAAALADGAEMLIARIAAVGDGAERVDAGRKLAALVGAVIVARAVGHGSLRDEILAACGTRVSAAASAPHGQ